MYNLVLWFLTIKGKGKGKGERVMLLQLMLEVVNMIASSRGEQHTPNCRSIYELLRGGSVLQCWRPPALEGNLFL